MIRPKYMKLNILFFALLLGLFAFSRGIDKDSNAPEQLPEPVGYVNDFEQILNRKQKNQLEKVLRDYEKQTTTEIVVVTVKTIEPYETLFDYSLNIAKIWGVGKAEKNNGVLIAVSKNLRNIRIQNGLGIEDHLTDEKTKIIISQFMIPEFKKGNYYEGILNGVNEIIKELNKVEY